MMALKMAPKFGAFVVHSRSSLLLFLSLLFCFHACDASLKPSSCGKSDLVEALPLAPSPAPAFDLYAGYLNVTGTTRRLFYLLAEADPTFAPQDAPVVVWLNGGPGCSSLEGFFREQGPFLVTSGGSSLVPNPYAYNRFAHIVYLESPAGVGFSYGTSPDDYNTGDQQAASDFVAALDSLAAKFPDLPERKLFIAGESYAGVYVPTSAAALLDSASKGGLKWNLAGIAAGNGITSYAFNGNALPPFLFYHSILSETLWDNLLSSCGPEGFYSPPNKECAQYLGVAGGILNQAIASGLNPYGLYKPCAHPTTPNTHSGSVVGAAAPPEGWFAHLLANGPARVGSVDPPCYDPTPETVYLNRVDVRAAFHTDPDLAPWSLCTSKLNYTKTVDDVVPVWSALLGSGVRILIYSGDTDIATNAIGNLRAVGSLKLPISTPRRSWSAVSGQLDGFVEGFDFQGSSDAIIYASVKGAGHLVPQDKPSQAQHLMTAFVHGHLP